MIFITAFITGLLGSLHCVGMCGPIALALPVTGNTTLQKVLSRISYNAGRLLTYSLLGFLFGTFGLGLKLAGLQQSISIIAGICIIIMALFPGRYIERMIGNPFKLLKGNTPAALFQRKSYPSLFLVGALNGLLPCGFVYIAIIASVATQQAWQGALFMLLFGAGTFPLMFTVSLAGNMIPLNLRARINKLVPLFAVLIGCLFMLRGFNLGIPYLSPSIASDKGVVKECCAADHKQ